MQHTRRRACNVARRFANRSTLILLLALLTLPGLTGCGGPSDETVLRETFAIPDEAVMERLASHPPEDQWLREGLRIEARFLLPETAFATYHDAAAEDPAWRPMPPSREFLLAMVGAERVKRGLVVAAETFERPLPPEGSPGNPTLDQLLTQWRAQLPLDVTNGLYRCVTAGDNLLHAPKRECRAEDQSLNDFMFAVLDETTRRLHVVAHTAY